MRRVARKGTKALERRIADHLAAALRRPVGSVRVLALIHGQALKLWARGARYHARPAPPDVEVTR